MVALVKPGFRLLTFHVPLRLSILRSLGSLAWPATSVPLRLRPPEPPYRKPLSPPITPELLNCTELDGAEGVEPDILVHGCPKSTKLPAASIFTQLPLLRVPVVVGMVVPVPDGLRPPKTPLLLY